MGLVYGNKVIRKCQFINRLAVRLPVRDMNVKMNQKSYLEVKKNADNNNKRAERDWQLIT